MNDRDFRVAILISGRGSNMATILNERDTLNADFVGVLSSRADAKGLTTAREDFGLDTAVVSPKAFDNREDYDRALIAQLDEWDANFLVLAGFMRILTKGFVERYEGNIVNIHPSLLPAFPGLHAQRQALAAGVRVSGCTVHYVGTGAVDSGPIIAQSAVPVEFGDDEASLAKRIQGVEHTTYPDALRAVFSGELVLRDNRVVRA